MISLILIPTFFAASSNFLSLIESLKNDGILIPEEIEYKEVGKMSGLLRCSTLPLRRTNNE